MDNEKKLPFRHATPLNVRIVFFTSAAGVTFTAEKR